jgi:hypothetical protein
MALEENNLCYLTTYDSYSKSKNLFQNTDSYPYFIYQGSIGTLAGSKIDSSIFIIVKNKLAHSYLVAISWQKLKNLM